jgi:hypothetical protein
MAYVPEKRANELIGMMEREFERSNKKFSNLCRRGFARKDMYLKDYKSFFIDLKRVADWLRV